MAAGVDYFPDTYDKRLGLWPSILIGIKFGEEASFIEPSFSLVVSRSNLWESRGWKMMLGLC